MIEPPSAAGVEDKEGGEGIEYKNLYENDDFMMYEFKIRRCLRGRSHDWTECSYVHSNEKARRRDLRRWYYSGNPCPDYRNGSCRRGDACGLAHGVFETWLHPSHYRTEICNAGAACRRRICFFVHSPEQLRVILPAAAIQFDKLSLSSLSSPRSTLEPPVISPQSDCSSPGSPVGMAEVVASMGRLGLDATGRMGPERTLGTSEDQRDASSVEEAEDESAAVLPDVGWILELVD